MKVPERLTVELMLVDDADGLYMFGIVGTDKLLALSGRHISALLTNAPDDIHIADHVIADIASSVSDFVTLAIKQHAEKMASRARRHRANAAPQLAPEAPSAPSGPAGAERAARPPEAPQARQAARPEPEPASLGPAPSEPQRNNKDSIEAQLKKLEAERGRLLKARAQEVAHNEDIMDDLEEFGIFSPASGKKGDFPF